MAVSRAAVIPGPRGINRVVYERESPRVWVPPPPPLPLRNAPAGAPRPRTVHQRVVDLFTVRSPRPPAPGIGRYRAAPSRVTPAQVRQARDLEGIGQWELAARLAIGRSSISECERGRRPVHPLVEAWTVLRLKAHGAWPEPETPEVPTP